VVVSQVPKGEAPGAPGTRNPGGRGYNPLKCSTWNIFILLGLYAGYYIINSKVLKINQGTENRESKELDRGGFAS
jgi:hypothetical protein